MNVGKKSLLIATLASVLAAPTAVRAEDQKADEGVPCWGINKCKGVGDCGAGGCRTTGCHGSNACRRKGFLRLEKETCLKVEGGRLTQAAAKPATMKPEAKKG
ncbi:MAG TPA: hypothetical protein VLJ18_10920 [Thermoanaerobaculia bacterium]|nr:hypothetical protein [Thermoanaerobaculia bacterium]